MRMMIMLSAIALAAATAHSQWTLENSNSTASLRGVHSLGGGIAWASGTNGTVLRTEDGGYLWQTCTIPPGAEKLDFRGIQAFDANTAIVMSSGKGDLSRLYKTTDGCQSWKLIFTNPDKDGFWDALGTSPRGSWRKDQPAANTRITVLGDPTENLFTLFTITNDDPESIRPKIWYGNSSDKPQLHLAGPGPDISSTPLDELHKYGRAHDPTPLQGEAHFAASNSSYFDENGELFVFVTGGKSGARAIVYGCDPTPENTIHCAQFISKLPLVSGDSAGAFSVAGKPDVANRWRHAHRIFVTVGGDYQKPDESSGTAAFATDGGRTWQAAQQSPHGYRSAVAYDATTKTWITVGPNGTDISSDDGKNWRAVKPNVSLNEPADADKNWNALSLPFVVGPRGRIGKLNEPALKAALASK